MQTHKIRHKRPSALTRQLNAINTSLTHRALRRRFRVDLSQLTFETVRVRIVHDAASLSGVRRLVYVNDVYSGSGDVSQLRRRRVPEDERAGSFVLAAYEQDEIVGSLRLTPGLAHQLPLATHYMGEMAALSARPGAVVELSELTMVQRCNRAEVGLLLMMAAHALTRRVLGAVRCVMAVPADRFAFYQAIFGFEALGVARKRVQDELWIQGLVQRLDNRERHLATHFRRALPATGLRLHEHFGGALPPCIEIATS